MDCALLSIVCETEKNILTIFKEGNEKGTGQQQGDNGKRLCAKEDNITMRGCVGRCGRNRFILDVLR